MINSKARCCVTTIWARNGINRQKKCHNIRSLSECSAKNSSDGHRSRIDNNIIAIAPCSNRLTIARLRRRPYVGFHVCAFSTTTTTTTTRPIVVSSSSRGQPQTNVRTLNARTSQWLRIPVESWTAKEVSQGRYLMEAWSQQQQQQHVVEEQGNSNNNNNNSTRAIQQSKILRQWLQARCSPDAVITVLKEEDSSIEIMEMLHQCLSAWRQAAAVGKRGKRMTGSSSVAVVVQEAVDLLYLVDAAGIDMQEEQLRPSNKAYSMCCHMLAEHADYPSALETLKDLWQRRLLQAGQKERLDLQLYNSFLHALAKCSLYHSEAPPLAEQILVELSSVGRHAPTAASFVAVMHAWASRGDIESAQRAQVILEQLIATDDPNLLSPEAFNVCIDGWAKANQPKKAEELLDRMSGDIAHLEPTEVSFNSAIHAWAKSKGHPEAPQKAEALLRRMESVKKCQPTLETYTAILDAWSRTAQPGPKVEKLLNVLEERHANDSSFPAPNKWTYMVAIRAWGATGPADVKDDKKEESSSPTTRAQALVDRMEHLALTNTARCRDLEPCPMVYVGLLDVWSRTKRSDVPAQVVDLFRRIPSRVLSDEERSKPVFHKVLGILATRGRAKEARGLLQETLEGRTVFPDIDSYNLVMMAYAKSQDENAAPDASSLLDEMERREEEGSKPTTTTYIHAMVAWGNNFQSDAAEQAESLFWNLLNKSQPDDNLCVAANCVLRAWSKSREGGAANKAESMWKWMEERGGESDEYDIKPDATSCLHMMQAWAHSGRRVGPTKADSYFLRLKDHALAPDTGGFVLKTTHFNLLIMAWAKSRAPGAFERVKELVDEMLELSSVGHAVFPDDFTKRCVAQAAEAENRTADAMSLLEELRTKHKAKRHRKQ